MTTPDELTVALRAGGTRVIRVASDRAAQPRHAQAINAAIAAAIG